VSGHGPTLLDDEVLGRAYDRRLMARLWRHTRPYRGALTASAALLPLLAAVDLVQPYLVKIAIDDHITQGDWRGLAGVAALYVATLGGQYILRFASAYLTVWTGQRVVHDLRLALFAHVQRLPAAFFDRTPVGRLMTRVLNDVEAIGELFASGAVAIFGDVLTLAGVVVVMLWLDWRLALVTFAAVPVLFGVAAYFRARARRAYREVRNRIARVNAHLQESLLGITVVQLFGREAAHAAEFARLNEDHRWAVFRRMRYDALLYAGVEVIGSVAIAGLIWWGGGQILAGALTFGVLVAFMEYTHRFFLPIRDLSAKYTVMQAATVAAERIFGLLDTPASIASPPGGYEPQRRPAGGRGGTARAGDGQGSGAAIEFRDVWFRYAPGPEPSAPDGDERPARSQGQGRGIGRSVADTKPSPATLGSVPLRVAALPPPPLLGEASEGVVEAPSEDDGWVLRGLSFRVAPGERLALVGATGAGKTTVARLLTRTYDVDRGAVLVDGVDVRQWDLAALRRRVGLVLQDVVVFAGTVAENLAIGRPDAGRAALEAAARLAHVDSFVRGLPQGYDEEIRERGANLSHGQRQLLAVGRALIYNPCVLVLDEATSSVDPETELLLQDALDRLLARRTSVIIAHRLSTIQRANRVVVLHRGRCHEDGTHEALLRRRGLYATLHALAFGRDGLPAHLRG
jgi:ATP-binding cassette, subfamily B, multidrug efflux pump